MELRSRSEVHGWMSASDRKRTLNSPETHGVDWIVCSARIRVGLTLRPILIQGA